MTDIILKIIIVRFAYIKANVYNTDTTLSFLHPRLSFLYPL